MTALLDLLSLSSIIAFSAILALTEATPGAFDEGVSVLHNFINTLA
jgi:hypothetical protein